MIERAGFVRSELVAETGFNSSSVKRGCCSEGTRIDYRLLRSRLFGPGEVSFSGHDAALSAGFFSIKRGCDALPVFEAFFGLLEAFPVHPYHLSNLFLGTAL